MTDLTNNTEINDWSIEEQNSWLKSETLDKWLGWLEEVISGVSEETWSYLQQEVNNRKSENKSED